MIQNRLIQIKQKKKNVELYSWNLYVYDVISLCGGNIQKLCLTFVDKNEDKT